MQELPFPDASFDLVVAQFGFMLCADYGKAFAEARRVLAPGSATISIQSLLICVHPSFLPTNVVFIVDQQGDDLCSTYGVSRNNHPCL